MKKIFGEDICGQEDISS